MIAGGTLIETDRNPKGYAEAERRRCGSTDHRSAAHRDLERRPPAGIAIRIDASRGTSSSVLIQGKPAEAIASELEVSLATVRAHIRSVLNKTATTRQAELIRVLLSGPELRDRD